MAGVASSIQRARCVHTGASPRVADRAVARRARANTFVNTSGTICPPIRVIRDRSFKPHGTQREERRVASVGNNHGEVVIRGSARCTTRTGEELWQMVMRRRGDRARRRHRDKRRLSLSVTGGALKSVAPQTINNALQYGRGWTRDVHIERSVMIALCRCGRKRRTLFYQRRSFTTSRGRRSVKTRCEPTTTSRSER